MKGVGIAAAQLLESMAVGGLAALLWCPIFAPGPGADE